MPPGHLDYYTRHGINPVRYDTSDLGRHLERRASLYRTLGLHAARASAALGCWKSPRHRAEQPARRPPPPGEPHARGAEPGRAARHRGRLRRARRGSPIRPEVVPCRFEEYETDRPVRHRGVRELAGRLGARAAAVAETRHASSPMAGCSSSPPCHPSGCSRTCCGGPEQPAGTDPDEPFAARTDAAEPGLRPAPPHASRR